jgi:diadenosine tetraphosphate (Ap4A) HIT family hydrolase
MPAGLDPVYWDDKLGIKGDLVAKDMAALKVVKAEQDIRMQGVPPTPAEYKISLDGWTAPEGVTVEIDEAHPLAAPARDFAHKHNLPQEAMNDLVRMQADYVAAEAKKFNEGMVASKQKLGANAQTRIDAVQTALIGRLGEPGKALVGTLISAEIVQGFEALLRTTAAPGPSANNGVTQPKVDMSKMSVGAKLAHILEPTTKAAAQRS